MKLNRKGYMLVEMILASVIAMSIAYYLLNLTYKFKDKNEDIYNSTVLIADKILITKNIMNDFDGKIVKIINQNDKEITLSVGGITKKITVDKNSIKYINEDGEVIYKKTLDNSTEIGKISADNNIISIPIKSIYSKNISYIKIFVKSNLTTTFNYTGSVQTYTVPITGYYYISLVGASGGGFVDSYGPTLGGVGDRVNGYIKLNKGENIYVYVGEGGSTSPRGKNQISPATFNGGGNGSSGNLYSARVGSGGGATDIRLVNGTWDDANSLKSRIMVAGGGGGAYFSHSGRCGEGGHGGFVGMVGHSVVTQTSTGNDIDVYVEGGPLKNGTIAGQNGTSCIKGSGGGGGGYYGGYVQCNQQISRSTNIDVVSAGGGSSFISGFAGVNAKSSDDSHTNNTLHYSGKYFIGGRMEAYTNPISSDDSKKLQGENGSASITYFGTSKPNKITPNLNNVRYIRVHHHTSGFRYKYYYQVQAIKDGVNVAKGKSTNPTKGVHPNNTPGVKVVNGTIDQVYMQISDTSSWNNGNLTVDLGETFDLDEIAVWPYVDFKNPYDAARGGAREGQSIHSKIEVSSDNVNYTTLFQSTSGVGGYRRIDGIRVNAYIDYGNLYDIGW